MKLDKISYEKLINGNEEIAEQAKHTNGLTDAFFIVSSNSKLIASNLKNATEINYLTNNLDSFNKEASKQSMKLIRLTCAIVFLTFVMIIGLIIQILIALKVLK